MPGLEGDAHLEELVLNLLHALKGRVVGGQGGHVVVGPPGELHAVRLALGQGAAVEIELELVGGPVEPDHHPCRKLEKAMGWNQREKMSALLSMAV